MRENRASWLLVSDVDDTLLGDPLALERLSAALDRAPERPAIALNSSRPCKSLRETLSDVPQMPAPDYLVGAMGTEIEEGMSGRRLAAYSRYVKHGWNREQVAALAAEFALEPHPNEFQTALKASYDVASRASYERFLQAMQNRGILAKAVFSGGKNLDLIPLRAGKGSAVDYLRERLGVRPQRVVVAGDSGNDLEMFTDRTLGIVVANADETLLNLQGNGNLYKARSPHAAGVLEGLRYWRVIDS